MAIRSATPSLRSASPILRKGLRLITHKSGMTAIYASTHILRSDLFVQLDPTDRLSPDFFNKSRLKFLGADTVAVMPRQRYDITNTVKSAVLAGLLSWRQLDYELISPKIESNRPITGVVFSRSELTSISRAASAIYSPDIFVIKNYKASGAISTITQLNVMLSLAWLSLISASFVALVVSGDAMPLIWSTLSYLIVYASTQATIPGTTYAQKTSLLMLVPFSALVSFVLAVHQAYVYISHPIKSVPKKTVAHKLKLNLPNIHSSARLN